jgi:hypothetical protein
MNNFHKIEPPRASEIAMTVVRKTIWQRFPNRSVVSGFWLRSYARTPLFPNCFLHVLPVSEYSYFKYYMKGIVLVSPGERGLWMEGTAEDRIQYSLDIEEKSGGKNTANWAVLSHLEAELLAEYKKYFPYTVNGIVGYKFTLEEQKALVGYLNKKFFDSLK